jgi:hypothetical protein
VKIVNRNTTISQILYNLRNGNGQYSIFSNIAVCSVDRENSPFYLGKDGCLTFLLLAFDVPVIVSNEVALEI